MPADISAIRTWIGSQIRLGVLAISEQRFTGVSVILKKLNANEIVFTNPYISESSDNSSLALSGMTERNGLVYDCCLEMTGSEAGGDYHFEAVLRKKGNVPLMEAYPLKGARLADHFYGRIINVYDSIFVTGASISCSSLDRKENAAFQLRLIFEEENYLEKRYSYFMPVSGQELMFAGTIENALGAGDQRYVVSADYKKSMELPFLNMLPSDRQVITLYSHKEDRYCYSNFFVANDNEKAEVSEVHVKLHLDLGISGLEDIWVTYNLFDHGQGFQMRTEFGEQGFKVSDIFKLVTAVTGMAETYELPGWLILKDLSLKKMTFHMQKDVAKEPLWPSLSNDVFIGAGFQIALDLAAIPIPLFSADGNQTQAYLNMDWAYINSDMPMLTWTIGFAAKWNDYIFDIHFAIPDYYFEGSLKSIPEHAGSIFPGFTDLAIKEVRARGFLKENAYDLRFAFVDLAALTKKPTFPLGKKTFRIDYIEGAAYYRSDGLGISIDFGFTFLTAGFHVGGAYEKTKTGSILRLNGGITSPVKISDILREIFEIPLSGGDSLNVMIIRLQLAYRTEFSGNAAVMADGGNTEFAFLCGILFDWALLRLKVYSEVEIKTANDITRIHISGYILLFGLGFSAAANIKIDNGSTKLEEAVFKVTIDKMSAEAKMVEDTKKKRNVIVITIVNANLGTLIEGLINMFYPDNQWYLPWPFQILKQLTLNKIVLTVDDFDHSVVAEYELNIPILFLTIKKLVIQYGTAPGKEEQEEESKFNLTLDISGLPSYSGQDALADAGDAAPFDFDLLNNVFPDFLDLLSPVIKINYLAVGQHIKVTIPTVFNKDTVQDALQSIKDGISKTGRPALDANSNWIGALDITLLKSVNVSLLMCDPSFYGVSIGITKGSDITKVFEGLNILILYAKVTETIGVFHASLALPEQFRSIELGAVQVRLGEIAISIYTNGNFKIDFGFPHNRNFSRSFGLTYLIFTGSGGFYLGILNGDTSVRVPKPVTGHFETVVELGLGLSVGVGREIRMGPLKAGASIKMIGIFEGVFASYISETGKDEIYYKMEAYVGVAVSVYGEVDFKIIKISFSVNLSFMAALKIESYRAALIDVEVQCSVRAAIKILFIKIHFSFEFKWRTSFTLGENKTAPWERLSIMDGECSHVLLNMLEVSWTEEKIFDTPKELFVEVVPYFSMDQLCFNENRYTGNGDPEYRIAFLPFLQGFKGNTVEYLPYAEGVSDTSFSFIIEAFVKRAIKSILNKDTISYDEFENLVEEFSKDSTIGSGYKMTQINTFLETNFRIRFFKSKKQEVDGMDEIHGIPFPMPPVLTLKWSSYPDEEAAFDLSKEPYADFTFMNSIHEYYKDLSVGIEKDAGVDARYFRKDSPESVSAYLFREYFYMVTKIALAEAFNVFSEGQSLSVSDIVQLLANRTRMDNISGMVSKILMGGLRVPDGEKLVSLHTFANQQFQGHPKPDDSEIIVHSFEMLINQDFSFSWLTLNQHVQAAANQDMYFGTKQNADTLLWELRAADLDYPAGELKIDEKPSLAPFFRKRRGTIELKNPSVVLGEEDVTIYETMEALPEDCSLELRSKTEDSEIIASYKKGCMLYIPITRVNGNVYSIDPIGHDNINKLSALVTSTIVNIEAFRNFNVFDKDAEEILEKHKDKESGLLKVKKESLFLYRTNLSLEAEKPLERLEGPPQEEMKNSASLNQMLSFLNILRDAGNVNAKGYFLTCEIPEHALSDNQMKLIFWVECNRKAEAVLLDLAFNKDIYRPVFVTNTEYSISKYNAGNLAFMLKVKEPSEDNVIGQMFQMLSYQIIGNNTFSCSNESMPVTSQSPEKQTLQKEYGYAVTDANENLVVGEEWLYTQIVPAASFAKCGRDEEDNPYRGIHKNADRFRIDFSFLDILGNRTTSGLPLSVKYGYMDPVIAPAAYPLTKCNYSLKENNGELIFKITFCYKKTEKTDGMDEARLGTTENEKEDIRTAYFQLFQADSILKATVFGKDKVLDKADLLSYMKDLYEKGRSDKTVTYEIKMSVPTDISADIPAAETLLTVMLKLERDEELIAESITDTDERELVWKADLQVPPDEAEFESDNIVKDAKGKLYYAHLQSPDFENAATYWALPPLSLNLISLRDITMKNLDGEEVTVSFHDIDLETWMEMFLTDYESYLIPMKQSLLEKLLEVKEKLAANIAATCEPIITDGSFGRENAVSCFQEQMRGNLHEGYQIAAVAMMPSGITPKKNYSIVSNIKISDSTRTDIGLTTGKIKEDGELPVIITHSNVSYEQEADVKIRYYLTDWEKKEGADYAYLTLLKPIEKPISLKVPFVHKRYPEIPQLMKHECTKSDTGYFNWNYNIYFSHTTVAQDRVFLNVMWGDPDTCSLDTITNSLARYIYLKDDFKKAIINAGNAPKAEAAAEELIAIAEEIADGFQMNTRRYDGVEMHAMSMKIIKKEGILLITSIADDLKKIKLYMMNQQNDWQELQRLAGEKEEGDYKYALPGHLAEAPYIFRFEFLNLDIRYKMQANTQIWIKRNSDIDNINPKFVYETGKSQFLNCLTPYVVHEKEIDAGKFTNDNFSKVLKELSEGFSIVNLELLCGRVIAHKGENLYSYLPVLYMPRINKKDIGSVSENIYKKLESWMNQHFDETVKQGLKIKVHATFFGDGEHNLAELTCLQFGTS